MTKFYIKGKPEANGYWEYCCKNDIPMIQVIPGRKYSKVSYDIYSMLGSYELGEDILDEVKSIYISYTKFFFLPPERFSSIGGYSALVITVHKEHAELIANHLFDFLLAYVRKNRNVIGFKSGIKKGEIH